jgi:MFS family permease
MGLPVALALLICRGPDDEVIRPPSTAQAVAGAWAPRAIWPILASAAIASLILFPLGYVLGGLLEEEALGGSALTGLAIAVLSAGGMVGALLLNVMARLGPADKQALAFVLAAGGLLCVSAVGTEEVLLLGAFAVGLGQGMTMPVFSHWILDASPPELRGRAVGLFQITFFLAQFAAPLAAQATVQAVGSTGGGLLWYAVANLLAFGILSVARIVNARAFTP